MPTPKTPEQAFLALKLFCSYRERCHFEVNNRLLGMGLTKKEAASVICRLIEEGFLNEERFAVQFAGGHYRQKKWGKRKIEYALRQKKISEKLIQIALTEIEGKDYRKTAKKLALAKWENLGKESIITRQSKTITYLLGKGYEMGLVREILLEIRS